MIPLKELIKKHDLKINGIIHIGAHLGQEAALYNQCGIQSVDWFEANPELIPGLVENVQKYGQRAHNALFTDTDNQACTFNVTSNSGKSSSILALKKHLQHHPHVKLAKQISLIGFTGDHILNNSPDLIHWSSSANKSNMLVIDVQGAELKVFNGLTQTLKSIDYIFVEVNTAELYEGCGLLPEVDKFLLQHGFKRVATYMTPHEWGDAFYMKK